MDPTADVGAKLDSLQVEVMKDGTVDSQMVSVNSLQEQPISPGGAEVPAVVSKEVNAAVVVERQVSPIPTRRGGLSF